MGRIAIIGSGIAGLGLAYYLRDRFDITVFEKNDYVGGHTCTVSVQEDAREVPIDAGFMVFNQVTYPKLTNLFEELQVPVQKTDMSFSVQHVASHLEFSGASLNRLFGDRSNLINLRYWRMLSQLQRFNREAPAALDDPSARDQTLEEYVLAKGYGDDLMNFYLIPMATALWSTPPSKIRSFPVVSLLRFFFNHGLFGVETQHQWWTVTGGSHQYVRRLISRLKRAPITNAEVAQVTRIGEKVRISFKDGNGAEFDKVVLACHADQSLRLLSEPTSLERDLLSPFEYQENRITLHTDRGVMPKSKRCWASWNYRIDAGSELASTHYWMNSLQGVSKKHDYFVSLNSEDLIDSELKLKELIFHHPIFSLRALSAQDRLAELNQSASNQQIFFAGSYFRFGFHEDALASAFAVAQDLIRTGVAA